MRYITQFNPVILSLITIDFFMNGALGIIAPFFAVFIVNSGQIVGGDIAVIGLATSIFWLVKSVAQLPIAAWLDKYDGETDEFWAFFMGYIGAAIVPLLYFFAASPFDIYVAQALFGLAMALAVPAWTSIFTRHIDHARISFEWSLYSVFSLGLATMLSAALGSILVDQFGFRAIFLIASVVAMISACGVFAIRKRLFKAKKMVRITVES